VSGRRIGPTAALGFAAFLLEIRGWDDVRELSADLLLAAY